MKIESLKAAAGRFLVWIGILIAAVNADGAETARSGEAAGSGFSAALVHPYSDWLVLLALLMFFGICWHENENHH